MRVLLVRRRGGKRVVSQFDACVRLRRTNRCDRSDTRPPVSSWRRETSAQCARCRFVVGLARRWDDPIVMKRPTLFEAAAASIAPDGRTQPLQWGPDLHLSSTYHRPGQEWGAGYLFSQAGCWDLHAVRGNANADVWLSVAP